VPADRLALAIGVGREDQPVGLLRLVGDRLQLLGLVGIGLPFHREPFVRVDGAVTRRQVADMAVGGENAIVLAEIFLDGLRLGRRFYDDELHGG
jgi:hypothetical protein